MGGVIDVESRPGFGSSFWFELPLDEAIAPLVERENLPAQLKGVRALAVDDIEMNLEIISRQLKGFGMEVACCSDGFDALAEVERAWHRGNPHDIVFIDQMMPGLAGERLAERIRAIPQLSETKLVLISSAGHHGRGETARRVLDAVLDKPIRQRDLLACLATLYAPPAGPTAKKTQGLKSAPSPASVSRTSRSLRILLAEDNKINQKFATALLSKGGHRVYIAENGHQAVDAVRRGDFDVILMDIQMPELDGIQATRQVRALPGPKSDIPIIALSAHALAGAREEYIAAGMDDYVSKPVDQTVLLSKLLELARRLDEKEGIVAAAETADAISTDLDSTLAAAGIDCTCLRTLIAVMEPAELRDFLKLYLGEAGERISRMVASSDLKAISGDAHALVGTSGNVGASQVSELARSVEIACRSGDGEAARSLLPQLASALDSTSGALSAWLKTLPTELV
jgi:CheY-like chemotaxis protein/HPt (histidine-containing phosphotransfer) domain-containing protein